VVRLALEQVADTVEFPVGEAEGTMERLLDDASQRPESSAAGGRIPAARF
jgi:hypothetical protein